MRCFNAVIGAGTDEIGAVDKDAVDGGTSKGSRFLQALNPRLWLAETQNHAKNEIN